MSESDLELYEIVGRMLREIREDKGLSLEIVAGYLKIAPKSLQRYECGERKIKMGTIKDLCNFYKISYDNFIVDAKLRFGKNIYAPNECKEVAPKIVQYYNQLNDLGKREAEKRIEELTYIPQYTLEIKAAHNDHESDPNEQEKMREDLLRLKKPD